MRSYASQVAYLDYGPFVFDINALKAARGVCKVISCLKIDYSIVMVYALLYL